MKGRVIKEINFGEFNGTKEGTAIYGWKISFQAGSEWELEVTGDMLTPMVRCRNGLALVVLSVDTASDIFGNWIRTIAYPKCEEEKQAE